MNIKPVHLHMSIPKVLRFLATWIVIFVVLSLMPGANLRLGNQLSQLIVRLTSEIDTSFTRGIITRVYYHV